MTDIIGPSTATAGAVTVRPSDSRVFGPDDSWFKDCTSAEAADGTDLIASWFNGITAMLRVAVRGMGISEGTTPDNFLRDAIRAGMVRMAISSGTADDLVVAFSPPFTSFGQISFIVTSPHENTGGPMTVTVDGLAEKDLLYRDGDVPAGTFGPGRYVLVTYDGNDFQVVSGGASSSPKFTAFTTSGTWTKEAGNRWAFMLAHGPGGAGGGASGMAPNAAGEGGGAGECRLGLFDVSAITSQTVTIGAGGAASVNANGGDGAAATSIGALLSANPGKGGARNNSGSATTAIGGSGGSGGFGINGSGGGSSSAGTGGTGGSGALGGGGAAGNGSNSKATGGAGHRGSGGGGADGNAAGGAGGAGFALIFEF